MSKDFKQLMDRLSSGGEPNWAVIMEVVELIQNKSISVKKANGEIRKKLLDASEPMVLGTLHLLDSLVKNTPGALNKDIVSPDILSAMKAIVTGEGSNMPKAVDKVLEMVGEWKVAFGDDPSYKTVVSTYFELESSGFMIPEAKLATASFMQKPPVFQEDDHCYYCRKDFGKVWSRRHHCRNCGRSICSSCHGKEQLALPHFGISDPQRVCITCYKKLDKSSGNSSANQDNADPISEALLGTGRSTPTPSPTLQPSSVSDRERELQEQDELQMALAISLSEQKKPKTTSSNGSAATPNTTSGRSSTSSTVPKTAATAPPPSIYATLAADLTPTPAAPVPSSSIDERESAGSELERYLDRSRWEGKKNGSASSSATPTQQQQQQEPDSAYHPLATTLRQQLERFTARMQAMTQQGGSIATDQAVLTLHQDLTAMHLQLLQQTDEVQQKKAHQESLLQKLTEAKEARVTLNAMRRQHQDQLLQQQREQEVLAQMQVQQKLALLRQQRAEEMAFGQTMQHQRLGLLSTQRQEYEMRLVQQREQERQQLIVQEQQVYQQQFGTTSLPAPPTSVQEQPGPLPPKEEPPSYNPQPATGLYQTNYQSLPQPPPSIAYQATAMPLGLPISHPPSSLVQPLPAASLVQPPPPASLVQPSLPPPPEPSYQSQALPPPQYYPPQTYVGYQQQHTAVPVSQQVPLYQPVPPPALTEPHPPPVQLQHQLSEPPLISFD